MTGLVLKDIFVNKKYIYLAAVVIVFYIIFGIMADNLDFIINFVMFFCIMFNLSTFAYDSMANWDMYAITLPVSRKQIVYAKYLLALLFTGVGGLISFSLSILNVITKHQPITKEILLSTGILISVGILFNSIQIPLVVKMGPEKSRFALIAIILLPTLGVLSLKKLNMMDNFNEVLNILLNNIDLLTLLVPIMVIIIFLLSLWLSVRIYMKKEF